MGEGNEKNILEKEIGRHGTGLAMQVSCVSIVINVVLSAFKVGAGILSHSGASDDLVDGIHSASDVFSTLIVMVGIAMASRKSDREHPMAMSGWNAWRPFAVSRIICHRYRHRGERCGNHWFRAGKGQGDSRNAGFGGRGYIHSGKRMDVLVYQGCCQKLKSGL